MPNPILVEVTRGNLVESRHRGAAAVVDADGATVLAVGDVAAPIFPRSAIKALQALVLVEFNERAELAAQLYKSGRAPAIILTNDNQQGSWSSAEQRNPFYYERSLALLTASGVPRAAITILPQP